jgi:hypothetical protein
LARLARPAACWGAKVEGRARNGDALDAVGNVVAVDDMRARWLCRSDASSRGRGGDAMQRRPMRRRVGGDAAMSLTACAVARTR